MAEALNSYPIILWVLDFLDLRNVLIKQSQSFLPKFKIALNVLNNQIHHNDEALLLLVPQSLKKTLAQVLKCCWAMAAFNLLRKIQLL